MSGGIDLLVQIMLLSTGNLQRLELAKALIHKPELLILDDRPMGLILFIAMLLWTTFLFLIVLGVGLIAGTMVGIEGWSSHLGTLSFLIVFMTAIFGILITVLWWRYADHS